MIFIYNVCQKGCSSPPREFNSLIDDTILHDFLRKFESITIEISDIYIIQRQKKCKLIQNSDIPGRVDACVRSKLISKSSSFKSLNCKIILKVK